MKTSELAGPLLDYWTAMAEREHLKLTEKALLVEGAPRIYVGVLNHGYGTHCYLVREYGSTLNQVVYSPSTNGQMGADIIEREKISVEWFGDEWRAWYAWPRDVRFSAHIFLVAAMRARVWLAFGEDVPEYPD